MPRFMSLTVLACAVALALPSAARSALPAHAAPAGFRSVDAGGRILAGSLGAEGSTESAFRAGLHRLGAYFGPSLAIGSVVRSTDGAVTMGTFRARLGGVPVSGLAVSTYRARATSLFAVLFDDAGRFATTLPKLAGRLRSMPPPVAANATPARTGTRDLAAAMRAVPTVSLTSNDGTVYATIPRDWQMKRFAEGSFVADGPDHAEVVAGLGFSMIDPRGPLYQNQLALSRQMGGRLDPTGGMGAPIPYVGDPAQAYRAIVMFLARAQHVDLEITSMSEKPGAAPGGIRGAEVSGTSMRNGTALRFDEVVGVGPPGPGGGWTATVTGAVAPADRFVADEPQMATALAGYRIDAQRRQDQVHANIAAGWAASRAGIANMNATTARDQAVADASMRNARAAQDCIDRSTAGFVRYLNDSDVVRRSPDGAHLDVDAGTSQALRSFDPQHFASVPVSQYVKGVDY